MDINTRKLCNKGTHLKADYRVTVIPALNKQALSLIQEKEDEIETSFADFLTYSEDGQHIMPVDSVAFRSEAGQETADDIKNLCFVLIGHTFCDFSSFSRVTRVEFTGHFSFISSTFQIISQLTSLTSVCFKLNKSQLPFFLEELEDDLIVLPENPSVQSLEVYADPEQADITIMNRILDVMFSRSEVCLPSLKNLNLQLPLVPITRKMFLRILRNSVVNPCEQELTYGLSTDKRKPTFNCVYSAKTEAPMPFHILTSWNSAVMRRFPKCFGDYYNGHAAKLFINRVFGSSESTNWLFTKASFGSSKSESIASLLTDVSEGWAAPYLKVLINFSFFHEEWELKSKIHCTENGKAFDTDIEMLWELGKAISQLRFQQNELTKPAQIEAAKRIKARRQAKLCRAARKFGVGNLSNNWLYDLTSNKYPRYPMTASAKYSV